MSLALLPRLFEEEFCKSCDVGVYEVEEAMIIKAPLPGVLKENVQVSFKENILTIQGASEEQKEMKVHRKLSNQYNYQIGLPQLIDEQKIEASLENGILTVTLPKTQAVKPIKITVK